MSRSHRRSSKIAAVPVLSLAEREALLSTTLSPTGGWPNWLPAPLAVKLAQLYPNSDTLTKIVESFSIQKPLSVRFNPLSQLTHEEVRAELTQSDWQVMTMPWYADAWILTPPMALKPSEITAALESTKAWQAGALYRQNLSSMIPPLVLSPEPVAQVLDVAAAPGSKTTQLAALLHNSGLILANDSSRERLYKLKDNLTRLHVSNTTPQLGMGQNLWKAFPHIFDAALADVPCSMEGRIHPDYPETYDHWSEKQCKTLAERQIWLLRSAISATKPGGVVVYSTCTLSPEEDELVVETAVHKSREVIEIEPITLFESAAHTQPTDGGSPFMPLITAGKTEWQGKKLRPDMQNTLRIAPTAWYEGFYVAKLRIVSS